MLKRFVWLREDWRSLVSLGREELAGQEEEEKHLKSIFFYLCVREVRVQSTLVIDCCASISTRGLCLAWSRLTSPGGRQDRQDRTGQDQGPCHDNFVCLFPLTSEVPNNASQSRAECTEKEMDPPLCRPFLSTVPSLQPYSRRDMRPEQTPWSGRRLSTAGVRPSPRRLAEGLLWGGLPQDCISANACI